MNREDELEDRRVKKLKYIKNILQREDISEEEKEKLR